VNMDRNKKIIFSVIIAAAAVLAGIMYMQKRGEHKDWLNSLQEQEQRAFAEAAETPQTETAEKAPLIKVYITGEVVSPGVYEVDPDCRVVDVLEIAGGATQEADLERINLAAKIKDAEKIVVPNIADHPSTENTASDETPLININTASLQELKTLPGIGDVIASNIIAYREKNGDFASIEEIKNVTRIGEKIFAQIMELITV